MKSIPQQITSRCKQFLITLRILVIYIISVLIQYVRVQFYVLFPLNLGYRLIETFPPLDICDPSPLLSVYFIVM